MGHRHGGIPIIAMSKILGKLGRRGLTTSFTTGLIVRRWIRLVATGRHHITFICISTV
jgi:hypothetical protein